MQDRPIHMMTVALLSVGALAVSGPRAAGAQNGVTHGQVLAVTFPAVTFSTVFAGVSPDGEAGVWEGGADGAVSGRITLELKQVEPPSQAASPVWHVRARWTLDADHARSFVADLDGIIDWKAGRIHLAGPISSGWMSGAWLKHAGRVVHGDISGSFTIVPKI